MSKIIINGAKGKMGKLAHEALGEDEQFEIVALLGRQDDLAEAIAEKKPDAVLDLTLASVVFQNARAIIQSGVSPIIGTSGLNQDNVAKLSALAVDIGIGGLIIPNFSLTAVLMMKYAQDAAKYLKNVELVEYHHDKKEEAPSGTAIRTAELISQSQITSRPRGRDMIPGALGAEYENLPIHSVRMPGFVASQEVIFGDEGETLNLRSNAISRAAFKKGIRLACAAAPKCKTLQVGLETIL
ncbi:MAG: 4-hydroxy-tetrahydrodipicolinate reductase [Verrucomicrobiota bacterium]